MAGFSPPAAKMFQEKGFAPVSRALSGLAVEEIPPAYLFWSETSRRPQRHELVSRGRANKDYRR